MVQSREATGDAAAVPLAPFASSLLGAEAWQMRLLRHPPLLWELHRTGEWAVGGGKAVVVLLSKGEAQ